MGRRRRRVLSPSATHDAKETVVTVSGVIPETLHADIGAGLRPRADYVVLAERLGAELVDYKVAAESLGRLGSFVSGRLGQNVALAIALFRRSSRTRVVLSDGEQIGLPYAALSRLRRNRPAHHMIVHIMSVKKKSLLFRALGLRAAIDTFFVYSNRQGQVIRDFGVDAGRVLLTSFMVDTKFFDPALESATERRMICSAGLEFRDYETLVAAVRGLNVEVVIAAASPWSKRSTEITGAPLPDNVTTCKLSLLELRGLYAQSAFVVMPLLDVEFQAGVTTILEAMSMGKAVVCTKTLGQTDVIEDGETGLYVQPGDVAALRAAIVRLLEEPDEVTKLGANARQWVLDNADIDRYADRLATAVEGAPS